MIWNQLNNKIQFIESVEDWKQAIRIAAKPLLENQDIESQYIDAMIEMAEKYHGYIVLNELFAMPHASYKCGVNHQNISMLILNQAVDFIGKPVQVLLVLAPESNTAHIEIIQQVAEYFEDVDFIAELAQTKSCQEIEALLKKYYNCEVVLNR